MTTGMLQTCGGDFAIVGPQGKIHGSFRASAGVVLGVPHGFVQWEMGATPALQNLGTEEIFGSRTSMKQH